MKNLALDRALVCFDLETTGTDVMRDRIVQIAAIRVEPDGSRQTHSSLVNPGCSIPAGATAVHGITDADVADAPPFAILWPRLASLFADADLAGFNMVNFDLPLLEEEVRRTGDDLAVSGRRLLDAMRIFHRKEPRDLTAALRFYCDEDLAGAHDALADTTATLDVLDAQLARYPDLPRDAAGLHAFCNPHADLYLDRTRRLRWNDDGDAVLAFGKHEGRTLEEMVGSRAGRGYLEWMVSSDFKQDVKDILREALDGVYPRRHGEDSGETREASGPPSLFPDI